MEETKKENILGTERIPKLLAKFAIPSIIALLVNAVYNIVDQIFIGNSVGYLGNAATNVAYPFTTIALAVALLLGQGGASKQNLALGAKDAKLAEKSAGNTVFMLLVCSAAILAVSVIFLNPLLNVFGATREVLPFAQEYARIIIWGLPFMIFSVGVNNLIRADGSPIYAMVSMLIGAVLNTVLDALFVFGLHWGIAGAAYATIIGQGVSAAISIAYLPKMKHIELRFQKLLPDLRLIGQITLIGIGSFFNQISLTILQIVLNNSMVYYGGLSKFGSEIPLAISGIMIKISTILMAVVIGIAQGSQPVFSFNYGARQYPRVRKTYLIAAACASVISVFFFAIIQLFPRQIISIFGSGDALYFEFAELCMRTFLFAIFLNGIQPLTTTFFTSIGKGIKGMFISLTRQLLFLVPLILILPIFFGIEGILYSGPVADTAAFILAAIFVLAEFKKMDKLALRAELVHNPC